MHLLQRQRSVCKEIKRPLNQRQQPEFGREFLNHPECESNAAIKWCVDFAERNYYIEITDCHSKIHLHGRLYDDQDRDHRGVGNFYKKVTTIIDELTKMKTIVEQHITTSKTDWYGPPKVESNIRPTTTGYLTTMAAVNTIYRNMNQLTEYARHQNSSQQGEPISAPLRYYNNLADYARTHNMIEYTPRGVCYLHKGPQGNSHNMIEYTPHPY